MLLIFMKTIWDIFAFTQSHIPITERIWRTSKFESICRKRRRPTATSFSVLSDLQKRRCDLSRTASLKPKWRFKPPVTSHCNLQLFAWNVVLLTDDRPTSLHFLMKRFANGTNKKKTEEETKLVYCFSYHLFHRKYLRVSPLFLYLTRKTDILVENVLINLSLIFFNRWTKIFHVIADC